MRFNFLWNELTQYFLFTRGKEKDSSKQVSHKKTRPYIGVYSKNLKKCSFGIVGQILLTIYSSCIDLAENFISKDKILQLLPRFQSKISEGKFSDVMIAPKKTLFLSRAMMISDSSSIYICFCTILAFLVQHYAIFF